jgi:hypothetical protein
MRSGVIPALLLMIAVGGAQAEDARVRFRSRAEAFHPNEIAAAMVAEILTGWHVQNPEHALWGRTRLWVDKAMR